MAKATPFTKEQVIALILICFDRLLTVCLLPTVEVARNLTTKSNLPLTIGHYLKNMSLLTDQWDASNYKDPDRQRIYLKDIDCPAQWHGHLKQLIPPSVFYLNEAPAAFQGPGAKSATASKGFESDSKNGIQIAGAGDLMSSLPPSMRAENLMCYIGHEGTYTPCHQEMCGSLGHNIMVEASDGSVEYGKRTKPGSSIWFMTETGDRSAVSEYWTSTLGHNIDIEDHFAQINAWKAAPFKTYVVDQKPGDFILIPPLAAHQVWNRGTRTIKVAWNRTTPETLVHALSEALPRARMVCRDEQYKNKAIVLHSLERYFKTLGRVNQVNVGYPRVQQLLKDFQQLFSLYTQILLSESFSSGQEEKDVDFIPFDSSITCSYCRCNIFNRFLTCPLCVEAPGSDDENAYDICMECYIMGRSCACISNLKWAEQFRWTELIQKHETWRQQIIKLNRNSDLSDVYPPLSVERDRLGKRTLAEICEEQLKVRPWTDITRPVAQKVDERVSDDDDAGPARKRKKLRKLNNNNANARCHVCKGPDPLWKLASCSYCNQKYCFGSLFRAFSIKPQDVMEQYHWKCPKCLNVCNCSGCCRDPKMEPFEPAYILGHDTRKIADPRSRDILVDFRHSNIRWLQRIRNEVARVQRRQPEEIHTQHLNGYSGEPDDYSLMNEYSNSYNNIPVDPALEQLDSSILTSPDSAELQNIARYALG